MLTGRFTEATSKEAALPADDPDATRYVLLVAHLQFSRLPTTMSVEEAAGIAKLADKYDCVAILENRVMDLVRKNASRSFSGADDAANWMWIAWAFRDKLEFDRTLNYICCDLTPQAVENLPELPPSCKGKQKASRVRPAQCFLWTHEAFLGYANW